MRGMPLGGRFVHSWVMFLPLRPDHRRCRQLACGRMHVLLIYDDDNCLAEYGGETGGVRWFKSPRVNSVQMNATDVVSYITLE